MKKQELDNFCSVVDDASILGTKFDGNSLIEQLNKYGDLLLLEIDENLLLLPDHKCERYLTFVKNRISKLDFDPNIWEESIRSLLKEYETSIDEIHNGNIHGKKIWSLLNENYNAVNRIHRNEVYNLQRRLVTYFTTLNVNKIIGRCNNLEKDFQRRIEKNNLTHHNLTAQECDTSPSFDGSIFRNKDAHDWFLQTLQNSGRCDHNLQARRGFQAVANAIRKNVDCRREILKPVSLLEYIAFLNREFGASIKSNKGLSASVKMENFVEEEFINRWKTRK